MPSDHIKIGFLLSGPNNIPRLERIESGSEGTRPEEIPDNETWAQRKHQEDDAREKVSLSPLVKYIEEKYGCRGELLTWSEFEAIYSRLTAEQQEHAEQKWQKIKEMNTGIVKELMSDQKCKETSKKFLDREWPKLLAIGEMGQIYLPQYLIGLSRSPTNDCRLLTLPQVLSVVHDMINKFSGKDGLHYAYSGTKQKQLIKLFEKEGTEPHITGSPTFKQIEPVLRENISTLGAQELLEFYSILHLGAESPYNQLFARRLCDILHPLDLSVNGNGLEFDVSLAIPELWTKPLWARLVCAKYYINKKWGLPVSQDEDTRMKLFQQMAVAFTEGVKEYARQAHEGNTPSTDVLSNLELLKQCLDKTTDKAWAGLCEKLKAIGMEDITQLPVFFTDSQKCAPQFKKVVKEKCLNELNKSIREISELPLLESQQEVAELRARLEQEIATARKIKLANRMQLDEEGIRKICRVLLPLLADNPDIAVPGMLAKLSRALECAPNTFAPDLSAVHDREILGITGSKSPRTCQRPEILCSRNGRTSAPAKMVSDDDPKAKRGCCSPF